MSAEQDRIIVTSMHCASIFLVATGVSVSTVTPAMDSSVKVRIHQKVKSPIHFT